MALEQLTTLAGELQRFEPLLYLFTQELLRCVYADPQKLAGGLPIATINAMRCTPYFEIVEQQRVVMDELRKEIELQVRARA